MKRSFLRLSVLLGFLWLYPPSMPVADASARLPTAHLQAGATKRSTPDPPLFALAPGDFPTGSRVVRAGVEGNRQLITDGVFHFGPHPRRLGRITGYYMEAQGGADVGPTGSTAYMVSLFASPRQAEGAWELRWSTWFAANYYTTPPLLGIALGDRGEQALFSSSTSGGTVTELFFRHGSVLIQVFQHTATTSGNSRPSESFFGIARKLSRLARLHPFGE